MPEETKNEPVSKRLMPKVIVIGLLLLVLLSGVAYAGWTIQKKRSRETPVVTELVVVTIPDHRIKNRSSPDKLTPEEYQSETAYYDAILEIKDPREALTELRKNVETDKALLASCHAITHELGWKALAKYNDFEKALEYLDEVCNTGYMHGVIEAKFSTSPDIYADLATVCNGHDQGRCLHGVGHGVMFYTENDLPKSLAMCQTFTELASQQYCAEGVFMENFNTDQKLHPSKYMSDSDLFYPCQSQKERYKYSCYYYAPLHYLSLNSNQYENALNWCDTAETNFVVNCVRGVSAVAIKQNISNPKFVESICMAAQSKYIPYCIDGMVGLYMNHYNSADKAYQMCATLLESNQKVCDAGVKSREGSIGEVKGATLSD